MHRFGQAVLNFGECGACLNNMYALWTTFACSPYQHQFATITAYEKKTLFDPNGTWIMSTNLVVCVLSCVCAVVCLCVCV